MRMRGGQPFVIGYEIRCRSTRTDASLALACGRSSSLWPRASLVARTQACTSVALFSRTASRSFPSFWQGLVKRLRRSTRTRQRSFRLPQPVRMHRCPTLPLVVPRFGIIWGAQTIAARCIRSTAIEFLRANERHARRTSKWASASGSLARHVCARDDASEAVQ